ncbi:hypothetical protein EDD70_3000 [Hydrogenoanaerobacterium saccharovorans]|uniref:Transmembrane protein n=1 Tax=Hydrogenoanaerobacterium saccharovorans TaxID=474960 RepID=A0A1H8EIW4_9FIRM|nr:hypothetical protein [Hydrogenoanaerobacterium saccharovorans]RPF41874.1 hypothetical protein EDD70_3000 [Hydrogenoanaerobacterium saccharovorans]SEN19521.1 hypothetical protein SAMN05216180_3037 [Hydrogenoanaerobacterium saccharovorans]
MQNIRAFSKAFGFTFLALTIIALSVMSVYAVDIDTAITPAVPVADNRAVKSPSADTTEGTSPKFLDSGVVSSMQTIEDVEPDNLPAVTSCEDDIHAIRQYIEFVIYMLLPLGLAVKIVVAFYRWFEKTFVDVF